LRYQILCQAYQSRVSENNLEYHVRDIDSPDFLFREEFIDRFDNFVELRIIGFQEYRPEKPVSM
jgi:hypothetical protein